MNPFEFEQKYLQSAPLEVWKDWREVVRSWNAVTLAKRTLEVKIRAQAQALTEKDRAFKKRNEKIEGVEEELKSWRRVGMMHGFSYVGRIPVEESK